MAKSSKFVREVNILKRISKARIQRYHWNLFKRYVFITLGALLITALIIGLVVLFIYIPPVLSLSTIAVSLGSLPIVVTVAFFTRMGEDVLRNVIAWFRYAALPPDVAVQQLMDDIKTGNEKSIAARLGHDPELLMDAKDSFGRSPLMIAIFSSEHVPEEVTEQVPANKPKSPLSWHQKKPKEKPGHLHLYTRAHFKFASSQPEMVKLILGKGAAATLCDDFGNNAFHYAALANHSKIMERLINAVGLQHTDAEAYENPFDHQNQQGHTPLMIAALHNHPDMIRQLWDKMDHRSMLDKEGNNALMIAAEAGNVEALKTILELYEKDLKNFNQPNHRDFQSISFFRNQILNRHQVNQKGYDALDLVFKYAQLAAGARGIRCANQGAVTQAVVKTSSAQQEYSSHIAKIEENVLQMVQLLMQSGFYDKKRTKNNEQRNNEQALHYYLTIAKNVFGEHSALTVYLTTSQSKASETQHAPAVQDYWKYYKEKFAKPRNQFLSNPKNFSDNTEKSRISQREGVVKFNEDHTEQPKAIVFRPAVKPS